ncbi:alpha/beta hydrolase [Chitinophaga nivalis]|uniref:Alpha/beta hydrolase n=1 Tax=Chitinophaga nivalis TaxID=2991709 RepID=A0ABT3IPG0_9BACT|nr:alpha/beta hydrolase [Chitinophaga nivalis]MCW3464472.1 alpha/beta hydrolase [Chitinophaga nivalis]MCW3485837.1 alpha/beta hydrolase [Chitinophaga nivalis]
MKEGLKIARDYFKKHLDLHAPIVELRIAAAKMYATLPVAADIIYETVSVGNLTGEWTMAPGASDTHVLYYIHGGAFLIGSPATHRGEISELGRAGKMKTFALDYRLAPEHPFPQPLEDIFEGYLWLLEQGYKAENIIIGGDSAGGNATINVLLFARDRGVPMPAGGILISPWIDLGQSGATYRTREGIDPIVSRSVIERQAAAYLGGAHPELPVASPVYAAVHGIAPVYVIVGEAEEMLSEALTFTHNAAMAGVHVRLEVWPRMIHNFPLWHALLPEGKEAIKKAGEFMMALTGGRSC